MSLKTILNPGFHGIRAALGALALMAAPVISHADIYINELDADTPGTDAAEFVELYNSGATAVTLENHVLVFYNGSSDTSYLTLSLNGLTIPAGGYAVIGNTGTPNVSSVTFANNTLQNGQDAVALFSGIPTAADFPNSLVTAIPAGAVLVDAVVYDTSDPDDPGLLAGLTPRQPQIDESSNGPSDSSSIGRSPDGGTLLNTDTYSAQTPTPGAPNGGGSVTPVLGITITPTTFSESAGAMAAAGTISRTGSTAAALSVTLTSANTAEATVPATVTIPIGATQINFDVAAIDDLLSDGNKTFLLTAAATGFTSVTRSITVNDDEPVLPALTVVLDVTTTVEGTSTGATVSRPDSPSLPALTVTLSSNNAGKAGPDVASVEIPASALSAAFNVTTVDDNSYSPTTPVIISAAATGFATATDTLNVIDNDTPPSFGAPTVVVNKYLNSTIDLVELLAVGNGTPGTFVDLRRMLLKDFSGNMGGDSGGAYRFADTAFFSQIKVGTLLVLSASGTSTDTTYADANDYTLRLSLADPTYFAVAKAGFDISSTEMVMIKKQDGAIEGVADSIHVLAGGTAGANFNLAPEYKLIGSQTTGTNRAVAATTTAGTLADFNGTDAIGDLQLTDSNFGIANDATVSGPNYGYIQSLRGISNINGTGQATIANVTPASPFVGVNIFPRSGTAQKAAITVTGNSPTVPLAGVKITVPSAFGTFTDTNVAASGPGAGTPLVSVSGQVITVGGTAVTSLNSITITVSGLLTPNPIAPTDESGYPFLVQTSQGGATFGPLASSPSATVLVPISVLRDIDASGLPLDTTKPIAFQGVCIEAQFSNNTAGDTTAFFQDGNFGMGLFISATALNLERGKTYAMTGIMSQFRGLSQIALGSAANIVDLGTGTEPTPLIVNVSDLLLNAEIYEGRLVKVLGLDTPTGGWNTSGAFTVKDSSTVNTLQIRVQAGSTATAAPSSYPVNITGVFGQFDSTSPFTSGYQLMPRDPLDLEVSIPPTGYDAWAAGFPGIGAATADFDGDSQSNYLEYALGTDPKVRSSAKQGVVGPVAGSPGITFTKGFQAANDGVPYVVLGSTDLSTWTPATADGAVMRIATENQDEIAVQYLGTSDRCYFMMKVGP